MAICKYWWPMSSLECISSSVDCSKKGNPNHAMIFLLTALKGYVDLSFKYSTGVGV
jgi:hypothetical protein